MLSKVSKGTRVKGNINLFQFDNLKHEFNIKKFKKKTFTNKVCTMYIATLVRSIYTGYDVCVHLMFSIKMPLEIILKN